MQEAPKQKLVQQFTASLILVAVLSTTHSGAAQQKAGARKIDLPVCANPKTPCSSPHKAFAPYELSFRLPTKIRANTDYQSVPFYAVVLRTLSDPPCDAGEYSKTLEAERKKAQGLFPTQKAFADHQCPDMGAVFYHIDGKPGATAFIAVYGGATRPEAGKLLVRAKSLWPGAVVRRMTVGWQRIEQ